MRLAFADGISRIRPRLSQLVIHPTANKQHSCVPEAALSLKAAAQMLEFRSL
jgi:hypothetical protein